MARPPRARPARPGRRAGHEPVRPPRLRASPPTATCRRASPARPRRSPGTSSSATSSCIYDENHISIEDDTDDRVQRGRRRALRGLRLARAVRRLAQRRAATSRTSTRSARAIEAAKARRDRPSFIVLRTIIGWPAPHEAEHRQGARLGARRRTRSRPPRSCSASTRSRPSRSTTRSSRTPARSSSAARDAHARVGASASTRGGPPTPTAPRCSTGCARGGCPTAGRTRCRPSRPTQGHRDPQGVRRGAQRPRRRAARAVGRLGRPRREQQHDDGGRAVVPARRPQTDVWRGDPYGRTLHFGIREHAMGSILNGIALHGAHPRRTAARSSSSATTCAPPSGSPRSWSCRSPTSGRTTPSASARTARPTSRSSTWPPCGRSPAWTSSAPPTPTRPPWAWRTCSSTRTGPAGLVLTRQNVPTVDRPAVRLGRGRRQGRLRAGRGRRRHAGRDPRRHRLRGPARRRGARARSRPTASPTRVVSMPCLEWFDAQDAAYRDTVLPPSVRARVSRRGRRGAGLARHRRRRRPDRLLEHFGASADYQTLLPRVRLHRRRRRSRGRGLASRQRPRRRTPTAGGTGTDPPDRHRALAPTPQRRHPTSHRHRHRPGGPP